MSSIAREIGKWGRQRRDRTERERGGQIDRLYSERWRPTGQKENDRGTRLHERGGASRDGLYTRQAKEQATTRTHNTEKKRGAVCTKVNGVVL